MSRPRVVIVGAGFGGLRAARTLRHAPIDVILIDRHNYHLFQPLLYQVATAGLEPEQIAKPVRAILRGQTNLEFRLGEVTGVDFAARHVVTLAGPVAYDHLILALGGETNFFGLESVQRHSIGLKDIPEAIAIRNHVLRCFEQAMLEEDADRRRALLTIVVVGGGPTGVEMAGALSELIRLVLVKDYPRLNIADVRVLLLEAADRLLGAMPAKLRQAAADTLWKKHVEVRFGAAVEEFDGSQVRLKGGEVIPARTLLWAAGVQAAGLTRRLGLPTARQGRLIVEATLVSRSRLARDDRAQCGGSLRQRRRVQGLPGVGRVAGGALDSVDRVPQQAACVDQLGVGLLLLRAGRADHHTRVTGREGARGLGSSSRDGGSRRTTPFHPHPKHQRRCSHGNVRSSTTWRMGSISSPHAGQRVPRGKRKYTTQPTIT